MTPEQADLLLRARNSLEAERFLELALQRIGPVPGHLPSEPVEGAD